MKVLVAISKVPDTTTKITLKGSDLNEEGVQWVINPYDEWYSLVRAIELKEKDPSTQVTVVSVGENTTDPILRKALAYGADEAIRVNVAARDSYNVAVQIAAVAQDGFDLVLTGKESIDYHQSAVGGMVAEILQVPFAALATNLEVNNEIIIVRTEIEGGEQVAEIHLPAVISCTKGMAVQRIPNMRGIMAARSKPLKVVEPAEAQPLTEVVAYELASAKAGVQLFTNAEDFVAALKEKKII